MRFLPKICSVCLYGVLPAITCGFRADGVEGLLEPEDSDEVLGTAEHELESAPDDWSKSSVELPGGGNLTTAGARNLAALLLELNAKTHIGAGSNMSDVGTRTKLVSHSSGTDGTHNTIFHHGSRGGAAAGLLGGALEKGQRALVSLGGASIFASGTCPEAGGVHTGCRMDCACGWSERCYPMVETRASHVAPGAVDVGVCSPSFSVLVFSSLAILMLIMSITVLARFTLMRQAEIDALSSDMLAQPK